MKTVDSNTAELLRAVIRKDAEAGNRSVAELARRISSWEEAVEAARLHGVAPALYFALASHADSIPDTALALAKAEFDRNAFHCMANTVELLEVLNTFADAEIDAIAFKGVVLAASAYRDLTARNAGDLDLLIRHRDLIRATALLKERGYELMTEIRGDGSPSQTDYFEYHFERAEDGMVLELRWRLELSQHRYRHDLGLEWIWPRRTQVNLAGARVLCADPVSNLLLLCMHGSKHVWSRLLWVVDVAKLLEREADLDWDFAISAAASAGLSRCLALGVLLAHKLCGTQVPASMMRRFESDRTARRFADFLEKEAVQRPGSKPGGVVPYYTRLLGGREMCTIVLKPVFLEPTERDKELIRLPRLLAPCYYLLRPFRLLLDRKGR